MSDRSLMRKIQFASYEENHSRTSNRQTLRAMETEPDFEPEDACEVSLEPGDPCPNKATHLVEEPWTPGRFKIYCCEAHAREMIEDGYHDRGKI